MYSNLYDSNDSYVLKVEKSESVDKDPVFLKIETPRELYLVEGLMRSKKATSEDLARIYLSFKKKELNLASFWLKQILGCVTTFLFLLNINGSRQP